jgi:hypothetical protein
MVIVGSIVALATLWLQAGGERDKAQAAAEAEREAKEQAQQRLEQIEKGV